ncbi:hypothetical protein C8R46DRAFT_1184816 [Mycena filopes]|nr:hypothetical protein C8R46DRAFT_1184816 [Mycena filopes]
MGAFTCILHQRLDLSSKRRARQPGATSAVLGTNPPYQCTIAITVGDIVIVLHTTVSGFIFVITGDGKQKCIEIKVAAPGPSRPLVAGANRPIDSEINVKATIRTMDAHGNTVKTEEDVDVKVEACASLTFGTKWDDVEEKIVPSGHVKSESVPAAALSAPKQISQPFASKKSKNDVTPVASASSPTPRSSLAINPTVANFATPPTRSDASTSTSAMLPPKVSPKKRDASELEGKRVRVEAKPARSPRKTRASRNAA